MGGRTSEDIFLFALIFGVLFYPDPTGTQAVWAAGGAALGVASREGLRAVIRRNRARA